MAVSFFQLMSANITKSSGFYFTTSTDHSNAISAVLLMSRGARKVKSLILCHSVSLSVSSIGDLAYSRLM